LNALAEQILDRQKRYSAVMANSPGKPNRAGISAEVISYLKYIADQLGITDPEIKAAILRTHPHIAQIIAMQQAGFEVDIQMNGLPPEFVEPDGDKPWPIYNPIKPDAIAALQEFIKILSLALSTEAKPTNNENQQDKSANTQRTIRLSTANEPTNIHIGNQARIYARRLLEAQLDLINNGSEITLIGPSIKTDYEGKLDTTFRIIDDFIEEIKAFVQEHNIKDPNKISELLKCLPTLTVYAGNAVSFMAKAERLVSEVMEKLQNSGLLGERVQVEINFSEMGIEWPYYQGKEGLAKGAEQMVAIVQLLKKDIQKWVEIYPQLKFTGIFFIHNPGGPDYTGPSFDEAARQCTSGIPVSKSPIPMLGIAPGTTQPENEKTFEELAKAIR